MLLDTASPYPGVKKDSLPNNPVKSNPIPSAAPNNPSYSTKYPLVSSAVNRAKLV
jgi:hypothetical protein